jgi:hypothetical protein
MNRPKYLEGAGISEQKMNLGKFYAIPALAAFAIAALSLAAVFATPVSARSASHLGGQFVNVSISFQSQMPLTDVSEKALLNAQHTGRKLVYQMASKECVLLKATIAKTCRLTNLNVSAQVRNQGNQGPMKLYLNGTAKFAITLDEKAVD